MNVTIYLNQSMNKQGLNFTNDLTTDLATEQMTLVVSNYDTEMYGNSSNTTLQNNDWKNPYKLALDLMLFIMLIVIMLSMGCEIAWKHFFYHVKRPFGLFIGMFSQFVILPLAAFCILLASGIDGLHSTGVLIISCCPSGVLSNTFSFFCDGELSLSIAMTAASTVMAMGMMPLNLYIYGQYFESDALVIPYMKMIMSLITVTSPTVVGMIIKWKFPRVAAWISKIGTFCIILVLVACVSLEILLFPNMFTGVPVKLYIVIFSLPIIGMTLGYILATLLKRSKIIRKTIAIECGLQNVPIALTVITLSFPLELQEEIVLIPWLYFFSMTSSCTILCSIYQFHKKYYQKTSDDVQDKEFMKKDPLLGEEENTLPLNGIKIEIKPGNLRKGSRSSNTEMHV